MKKDVRKTQEDGDWRDKVGDRGQGMLDMLQNINPLCAVLRHAPSTPSNVLGIHC